MYNVVAGDTFDLIARKKYGTEVEANRIAAANPGVSEPLIAGTVLTIPNNPSAPKNLQQKTGSNNVEEMAVLINGKRFKFWDKIRIIDSLDTLDTIEFSAPFDVGLLDFKEAFRPFSFQSVVVTVGGDPIFTGTMLTPIPVIKNESKTISVNCYSLPGVLNDCTMPASSQTMEFKGQGLREILSSLLLPFGLSVEFQADQGEVFTDPIAIEPTETVLTFIIKLLKQRNLILSSDSKGKLIILKSAELGNPVGRLEQGVSPVLAVTPNFNPQKCFSHMTGLEPVGIGSAGSQFTVKNSRLLDVVRPFTFTAPDTSDGTLKTAVEATVGRMFGNMVSYSVRVATHRNPSGDRWAANTTVILHAPDAMVYNDYEFIIRSVEFEKDEKTETATLNLVLPGSFSGKIPNTLPWD